MKYIKIVWEKKCLMEKVIDKIYFFKKEDEINKKYKNGVVKWMKKMSEGNNKKKLVEKLVDQI